MPYPIAPFAGRSAPGTAKLAGSRLFPLAAGSGKMPVMAFLPVCTFSLVTWLTILPAVAFADPLGDTVERFVREQTRGLPGKVSIVVGPLDARSQMPACSTHEAFAPPGTRFWGRINVGLRCLGPHPWSLLVPVQVSVEGPYVLTARALNAGKTLQPDDLQVQIGDLTALPNGVVTVPANAVGKSLRFSLGSGQPLRSDQLQAPLVIRQGQTVHLVTRGHGFTVSGEGKAIGNAVAGQVVQIRMSSGQVVSAVAKADGTAEISF